MNATAEGVVAWSIGDGVIKLKALTAGEVVLTVVAGEFSANVTLTVSEAEEPEEPVEPSKPDLPEDVFE